MDYSLIEQLLGLPRIKISHIEQGDNEILICIYVPDGNHRCPQCGKYHQTVTEVTEIKVRDLSIFGKICYLIISKARLHCPCCYRGYEELDFVDDYQRQTNRFDEFLFALCDRMTIMDASKLMQVDWKHAYKTDRQTLEQLKTTTPLPTMSVIGVDEISIEKHHKYFTIVYDLSGDNGTLYVGKDRTAESLSVFFQQLSAAQREQIKAVCMDMWDPYILSVHEHLPHAEIIFDRFHLKKHLNQCIDTLRRTIVSQAPKEQKRFVKDKRWVLLKKQSHHTAKDKQSLQELKEINSPLYEGYLVKEQFDSFFDCAHAGEAKDFLEKWYQEIPQQIKTFFQSFYRMIQHYLSGVLSYFTYRITNSKSEGINNKIKVLKRMAYGYRDAKYFQLKILRRCGYLKNIVPVF